MRELLSVPKRRFWALPLLAVAAVLAVVGSGCYTVGVENTWIRVQNMGSAPANIEIKYMKEDGTVVASEACPTWGLCSAILPGGGWTFQESQNPGLPQGFQGSAVITSDQPIAVLMGRDSDRGGGFFAAAGDTVALNTGSDKLYLPLVAYRDGPAQNWYSRFAVENMGDSTACAALVYTSNFADAEVHRDPDNAANPSPTPDPQCPNGGISIPPGGSLLKSALSMGVGPNFTGSVRVDLQTNAQKVPASKQSVVASSEVFSSNSSQFASYSGFTTADMGTSLLLPLTERQAGYQWSTNFEIMNSDPTQPANVTLRIDGWDSSQNPPQFIVKQNTFQLRASRMCFQDSDTANCLAPGDVLPLNFNDGVARISSDKPVGVVVTRSAIGSDSYVTYSGVRTDTASKRVYLPLVNKNSPTAASRTGWSSWVRVLVADGGAANLTVRYIGPGLPGGESSYTIPIYRSTTLIQPWDGALPDSFTGSAILESDQPIVALADVTTGNFAGDPDLMYSGVAGP